MNGVFSPMAVRAAVAFCTLSLTLRAFAGGALSHSPTSENGETITQSVDSTVYEFVGYVTLSPDSAFSEREPGQMIRCEHVIDGTGDLGDSRQPEALSCEAAVTLPDRDEKPILAVSATNSVSTQHAAQKSTRFVARPLSAIRLDSANKPLSRTGEPLKAPAVESTVSDLPVEEHYTPAPWNRPHPDRNTFAFRHNPLYFEDPNLERCGHSAGYLTEAVNIAHFAGRIPILPYMMGANPPCECVRALPDCPTCHSFGTNAYVPEPTLRAIATQAAATTGFIFLVP